MSQSQKQAIQESFAKIAKDPRFVSLVEIPDIRIDLRYASLNNFMNEIVYENLQTAYLHQLAADALKEASQILRKKAPHLKIVVWDALRPASAQQILWSHVVGTPEQKYVADPAKGSIHSYGLAVDLGLCFEDGRALDFGTEYDQFDELAEPQHEERFLKENRLTVEQVDNRRLLREVMFSAGFHGLPHEWWHFDLFPPAEVRQRFEIVF